MSHRKDNPQLAPQLQQSLLILQAPLLELRNLVQQEMETNPVLEEVASEPGPEEPAESQAAADEQFKEEFDKLAKLDEEWRDYKRLPEELRKVKLYESNNHQKNFIDCVKSRQPTITPAETAHHSAIPGHLGLISMLTGRKIRWDVKREKILENAEASKLLTRAYRPPWKLG